MLHVDPEDNTVPECPGFEFGIAICQARVYDKNENRLRLNWATNDHTSMDMVPIGSVFPQ